MIRTRIAGLHVSDSKPVVGETITIRGYLQQYDEEGKKWEPLRGLVKLYVDGFEFDRTATNPDGSFEFKYRSSITGERKIEARFIGGFKHESCKKEILIEYITREQKRKMEILAKIALAVIFLIVIIVFLLFLFYT